jgi:hypothetical protein
MANALSGLAAAATTRGELETAARLLGAVQALVELIGNAWLEPYEKIVYDEATLPVTEKLDDPAFAEAWAAGRAMSESDAAAFAVSTVRKVQRAAVRCNVIDASRNVFRLVAAHSTPRAVISKTFP